MPAVWLPPEVHTRLHDHAVRTGRKHSEIAVEALGRYFDEEGRWLPGVVAEASTPGEHYIPDD